MHRALAILSIWLGFQSPLPAAQEFVSKVEINAAIERGVVHLLRIQNRDGSFHDGGNAKLEIHRDQRNGPTAFALYTLLKSDVPRNHPAIDRGITYLKGGFPNSTYGLACELVLFSHLGPDAKEKKRMKALLEGLLRNGSSRGFAYPRHGTFAQDMSNTQYAALGIWAASKAGLRVPKEAWEYILEGALAHQEPAREQDSLEVAGFGYGLPLELKKYSAYHSVNGAMTVGSLVCLHIAAGQMKLKTKAKRRVAAATEQGLNWMQLNYTVDANPKGILGGHYYYLYGLERLASLFELKQIAEHDWYGEGSTVIVKGQRADGAWGPPGMRTEAPRSYAMAETCFALLFLNRATSKAPLSGQKQRFQARIQMESTEDPLWVRASGGNPLRIWVSGFPENLRSRYGHGDASELYVERVEFLLDGKPTHAITPKQQPWVDETLAAQLRPKSSGDHSATIRVALRDPNQVEHEGEPGSWPAFQAQPDAINDTVAWVDSRSLSFSNFDIREEWMDTYASDFGANLLTDASPTLTATSSLSDLTKEAQAIDGLAFTTWVAAAADDQPTLTLEFPKAVRANRVLLSPAHSNEWNRDDYARVTRIGLRVNGSKRPYEEYECDQDWRLKIALDLKSAQRIQRLDIKILESEPSRTGAELVGFAELDLRFQRR